MISSCYEAARESQTQSEARARAHFVMGARVHMVEIWITERKCTPAFTRAGRGGRRGNRETSALTVMSNKVCIASQHTTRFRAV